MPVRSRTFGVASGTVGGITLAGKQFSHLGPETVLPPDGRMLTAIRHRLGAGRQVAGDGDAVTVRAVPGRDTVGDLRIRFFSGDTDAVSVVGLLDGAAIRPFTASNGRKISMFRAGTLEARQMFDDALATNTMWTWVLRLAGFVIMFAGFKLIFGVAGVLGDIIPLVGDVFRFATGLAAFALAALISALIIGIAWIYYRPLLGLSIMGIGLIFAAAAFYAGKGRARKAAADPGPA